MRETSKPTNNPRSERFAELLEEADGDLRQYVQDVLLEAWTLYDKTDQKSRQTVRIATLGSSISFVCVVAIVAVNWWLW